MLQMLFYSVTSCCSGC